MSDCAPVVAIAVVGDPRSPLTWSGIPASLGAALRDLGVTIVTLDLRLPGVLDRALLGAGALPTRNRYDAEYASVVAAVRRRRASRALARLHADGIIELGTEVSLVTSLPLVTFEDMTLRQATLVHPVFSRMSAAVVASSERRRLAIYRQARRCCFSSEWAARSASADYGLGPQDVAVVGVGANHLVQPGSRDWERPRFLFVGLDWERKGGPRVLRAFARLRAERPDAALNIVGGHPPIDAPGVTVHGVLSLDRPDQRAELAELFATATCLVMPSSIEPAGIVYVEAGSIGVPSIVTAVGGARELIGEGGGAVVDPGDDEALLAAMRRLADAGEARRAGDAARARAALYTWPLVAQRLLRALGLPASGGDEGLAEFL